MSEFSEDGIYYRIQRPYRDEYMSICEVQWFDEFDYDDRYWLVDENGASLLFLTEDEARIFLRDNIQETYIRPEDQLYYSDDPQMAQRKYYK